ncbi:Mannose-P-dolichol utilization defect 1 protein [Triplophysa tibetana]|uniref:Mannose-P-dolichol utilization defect 1 protein n=1 Tax=Triplophysa tibetana TaxID=1572043 RepID=A0A5A9P813_9TELE|nr:Mannose-P-dolichol utilization defect 1 protein [Triplophysa tibetana]
MDTSEERRPQLKEFLLTFMPEKCYDQFFLHFNVIHVPCLKIVLSKTMGLLVLMATVFAPLAQIGKVVRSGRSDGLCLESVFLELLAISAHGAFCYTQNFPNEAWGESLFALIQIAFLTFLIQHYRGKTMKGVYLLALYFVFMYFLVSPLTPVSVVWKLREWNVLFVIAGRLIQACNNYRFGHTGQLSALSILLDFWGSLGRIFSSLQETGLSLPSHLHAVACCCSGVILIQVLLYWNICSIEKVRQVEKEKDE